MNYTFLYSSRITFLHQVEKYTILCWPKTSRYTFRQQGREIHIPLFEKYVKKYTSPIETEAVRCSAKSYFVPETTEKSNQGSRNSSPIPETSYEDIFLLDTTEEDTKN